MRKKTIEHIFDAYVDKLPDHDFGGQVSAPPETIANTAADAPPEPGVKPKVAHQEDHAKDAGEGLSAPSSPPGKLSNSSRASSGYGRSKRELSRITDENSNGDERGGGVNGVAGAEDDNDACDSGNSRGDGDGESTRPAFAWVASHEGDAGPHSAVLARNAEWAVVARDVRFRLASTWLSCDQVCSKIYPTISLVFAANSLFCHQTSQKLISPSIISATLFHVFWFLEGLVYVIEVLLSPIYPRRMFVYFMSFVRAGENPG